MPGQNNPMTLMAKTKGTLKNHVKMGPERNV